jgi:hypothetical protein
MLEDLLKQGYKFFFCQVFFHNIDSHMYPFQILCVLAAPRCRKDTDHFSLAHPAPRCRIDELRGVSPAFDCSWWTPAYNHGGSPNRFGRFLLIAGRKPTKNFLLRLFASRG